MLGSCSGQKCGFPWLAGASSFTSRRGLLVHCNAKHVEDALSPVRVLDADKDIVDAGAAFWRDA